jgi:hypothetical protein
MKSRSSQVGSLRHSTTGSLFSAVLLISIAALTLPDSVVAEDAPSNSPVGGPRSDDRSGLERWRDATPAGRRSVREGARERWQRATPRERRVFRRGMIGLRLAVPEFSEIERLVLLRHLATLSKPERRAMRRRLGQMDDLDRGERAHFIEELRAIVDRPHGESQRLKRNVDRWKKMSESDRDRYRDQMRRFQALPVDERRRLLDEWEDLERTPKDVD